MEATSRIRNPTVCSRCHARPSIPVPRVCLGLRAGLSYSESLRSLRIRQNDPQLKVKQKQYRCSQGVRASAAAASPAGNEEGPSALQKIGAFQVAFWKFLRPHTIRGTILGSCAVTACAVLENPQCIDWSLLPRALIGVLALLCGNGYIVGINQIFDVDIDAVNKPFLPMAAGDLSAPVAWVLCAGLAAGGLLLTAANFGPLVTALYSFGLFLGTIYSVPPLRLKQNAIAAFMIIATVRGFLLNFGVYHAARAALKLPFKWSPSIGFITVFVTVFATVIAITKDLPDVEGDRQYKIDTFATRLGVRKIAFLGAGLLVANYAGAAILGFLMPSAFNVPLMVGAHAVLGATVIRQAIQLDKAKYTQAAIAAFYQVIWNCFYAEYVLLPFL